MIKKQINSHIYHDILSCIAKERKIRIEGIEPSITDWKSVVITI